MLTGIAVFLLLIIALLAIPVILTFKVSWQQNLQGNVELLWLFSLVRIRLSPPRPKAPSMAGNKPVEDICRAGRTSRKRGKVFNVLRNKAFRQRIFRFIGDCWRAVHKRNLSIRVRIGLGDPADTGQLWAIIGPVAGILANARDASIEIVPEFIDPALDLDSSGNIRIIPLQMLYLAAGLLLSPPVWRGIQQIRKPE